MANTVAELTTIDPESVVIRQAIAPWSNQNRPGYKLYLPPTPLWMIQHTTGNTRDWATAESHEIFHNRDQGGPDNVSFHLCVDYDSAIQLLPLDECGYHAGDGMDSYWTDVGGFGGIAMELCVNWNNSDRPDLFLLAKARATAVWALVMQGSPKLNWGTTAPADITSRLSLERYVPHRRVSDYAKWCPTELLNEGNMDPWTGNGPMKEAIRFHTGGMSPVPDEIVYPDGLDYALCRGLFDRVVYEGSVYQFNPKGSVSKLWIEVGKRTGQWPALVSVQRYDTRRYFRFSNGLILWTNNNGAPKELK